MKEADVVNNDGSVKKSEAGEVVDDVKKAEYVKSRPRMSKLKLWQGLKSWKN